jgi:hypothetical protein
MYELLKREIPFHKQFMFESEQMILSGERPILPEKEYPFLSGKKKKLLFYFLFLLFLKKKRNC